MPVPNTFANATSAIPLSQLDNNFATAITLGNTAIQLGNTVSTLNNMTLANVTISSGSVSVANATVTGNVTMSGGNLAFTSTGQRITGDFGNSTISNRLMFQSSTTNGGTTVSAIPNGTSQVGSFVAFNNSDPTNGSTIQMVVTSSESKLAAGIAGTGTYLPMTFYTNNAERVRVDSSGNVGIGTSSPGALLNVVANTASDALRITQIGAGNALVVEDSANPDATPFVIDASGFIVAGYTANITGASYQANGGTPFSGIRWNAASTGPTVLIGKSRSATVGTNAILSSGDTVGNIAFSGDDGAAFIQAASISAAVDGTPGTNDMPGRLVFSTTADGASTPTERMRIRNDGNIGIGGTGSASISVQFQKNITGATNSYGTYQSGVIQSDVTNIAGGYATALSTQAASFTVATMRHFFASQGTIGATSTVTSQSGFHADTSLIDATNNYGFFVGNLAAVGAGKVATGFYSNVNVATGGGSTYQFYAAGTAANYFAGDMQLDKTVTAGGTTGAQTINKNAGTVNFAAAATSLVVTNNRVTANSIIIATVATNDTTMKSVIAVAGAGSFTLTANAAATAETRVNWLVIN